MDRYEDISDCEVDHSFFDSDFEEEVKKDRATTEINKMKSSGPAQIKGSVTDDCHLKQKAKVMEDNSIEEEKQAKQAEYQKENMLGNGAHNSNNALSLLASLNLEDPVDRITAQNEQTLHENISVQIPLREKECEENYYTDAENSSDDSRNQRVRHKFSKQPNGTKVNRNDSSSSSSPSSSSDTDYSDTDGCLSDSSCSSGKKPIRSPLLSSEQQSNEGKKSVEVKSKLGDHAEESEDTVTDVTPLSTPDISPIQSFEVAASNDKKLKVKRQQNVSQELHEPGVDHKCLQKVLHEAMDLNNLLKAFLQLEKKDQQELALNQSSLASRKNYSFTNDEVRQIDRENQRLLKELTKHSAKPRNKSASIKKPSGSAPKMYHSAINRQKEQQRIDRENLAFLKRLEAVKPTTGMKRSEQLTDYQRQMGYFRTSGTPRRGKSALNHQSPSRGTSRTSSHSASSTINQRSEKPVFDKWCTAAVEPQ
ncbi:PREDICTED: cilia- and flagella-associated protein 97 isoform X1 [Thamnophis sirtalis]|uniref:Cilia- and flagella-associated protein 97 n=1 Tax=Thamnophis sirtalis TaxID=35019 RepID=A0A6I9XHG9_9SAUR|nr:PREDICTED: cilia- and flagella-associated protein 97 isoform X1 [Thamnophis sirtalis]XP_013910465.1 PREDICTED: cilia- and flagella-associated protein 97 isoform X1 [Thamnophis sirtalis]XP_013910466.1 PREDICTED: cilia- and flagella-associated protein 97 isoform X1 [Thamnophis sirtalis]XP_013910467.1 PREDICTED: cilia- and flagella-associated protein 97 isoform X1 [Thamnophis sirtalis]XP_013910468.1 PREDICTED: cilia- and flagella-associated protein 97 isoform X1 [Thamnophis sirtalis]XP_0139104